MIIAFYRDVLALLGFTIRGFILDVLILTIAYVLYWGPVSESISAKPWVVVQI